MVSPQSDNPLSNDQLADVTRRFYAELHEIARGLFASERAGHTLQPTAIVNEACLRLLGSSPIPEVPRSQRLALAARVMRQVLIDHARGRAAEKRGGGRLRIGLHRDIAMKPDTEIDFTAVHDAIERLRELHDRQAEVVTLRLFGGLTMREIAEVLNVSIRTVEGDWAVACAWLRRDLARKLELER